MVVCCYTVIDPSEKTVLRSRYIEGCSLTCILSIVAEIHAPREGCVVVELLICPVHERWTCIQAVWAERGISEACASVVAADKQAAFVCPSVVYAICDISLKIVFGCRLAFFDWSSDREGREEEGGEQSK
jgi:hypothetical protein